MSRAAAVRLVDPPWFEFAKAVLADTPNLTGAACAGRHALFDPQAHEDGETTQQAAARHERAMSLCRWCPALAECRAGWIDTDTRRRPAGVIAGVAPRLTRTGRPRSE